MDPTTETPTPNQSGTDFSRRVMLLRLTIASPLGRQVVDNSKVTIDMNLDRFSGSARLLKCAEMEAIKSLDYAMRRDLVKLTLPSDFKAGIYVAPVPMIPEIDKRLVSYQAKRLVLVEKLLVVYGHPDPAINLVERDRAELRSNFRAEKYPTVEELRRRFVVEYSYFAADVPEALEGVSRELFEREKGKAIELWRESREVAQAALREAMGEMVGHLLERLQGERAEGKPKTLRESTVNTLWDFLDTFEGRNVADDAALQKLVADARAVLTGTEIKTLRTDEDVRKRVVDGFSAIKAQLDTMIIDRPARRMRLDDESDAAAAAAS